MIDTNVARTKNRYPFGYLFFYALIKRDILNIKTKLFL